MAEQLTRMPRVREVWSSNPGPAKSYAALQRLGLVYQNLNQNGCGSDGISNGVSFASKVIL